MKIDPTPKPEKVLHLTPKNIAEEEAMHSAIVASSEDAIISKDLNGYITSWNSAAEKIFGYSAKEMIGQPVLKLIPFRSHQEEQEILTRIRNGLHIENYEAKRLRKDGKLIDVSLTISPVKDLEGRIVGASKIARDITAQKMTELKRNSFLSMVSHELQTPLTSTKLYIQLLLSKAKKDEDSFAINALTKADVYIRKMTAMIHSFLDLSRIEEGKMGLSRTDFFLDEFIQDILEDARLLSPFHNIEYHSNANVSINADRDKLGQVMLNLLSNAAKYSAEGTKIEINCSVEDQKVKIGVKDYGIGISQEDQKELFERFYRTVGAQLGKAKGFGIGLYLCREILVLHGSQIHLESEPNVGSTFWFYLDHNGLHQPGA